MITSPLTAPALMGCLLLLAVALPARGALGPGVPAPEREHVFDSFFQGAPPDEGRVKGSGLGLAIAREYAMAHGGRIEAVDRPDGARGACFRLVLPLAIGARVTAPRRGLTVAGVE